MGDWGRAERDGGQTQLSASQLKYIGMIVSIYPAFLHAEHASNANYAAFHHESNPEG